MKRHDRLDSLRIISPCDVPWSSMKGDDAVRFCGKCRKNVYRVAAMTRQEALDVIERAEGRVCMQLSWRRDGTVATGDCWARLRRARRRGLLAFMAVLPIVLATQLWTQAFGLRALLGFLRTAPAPVASGAAVLPPPPALPIGYEMAGEIAIDENPPNIEYVRMGLIGPSPEDVREMNRAILETLEANKR
jgi:hypothetical protein